MAIKFNVKCPGLEYGGIASFYIDFSQHVNQVVQKTWYFKWKDEMNFQGHQKGH